MSQAYDHIYTFIQWQIATVSWQVGRYMETQGGTYHALTNTLRSVHIQTWTVNHPARHTCLYTPIPTQPYALNWEGSRGPNICQREVWNKNKAVGHPRYTMPNCVWGSRLWTTTTTSATRHELWGRRGHQWRPGCRMQWLAAPRTNGCGHTWQQMTHGMDFTKTQY